MRFDERTGPSVLGRALRLLETFGPDDSLLSLGDLTARSELPKPTALRLARQLVDLGLLERRGPYYCTGMKLFELGSRFWPQRRLREAALPIMENLYEATHEIIHLGVLAGSEVLYLDQIARAGGAPIRVRVGSRRPVHCTALGKALLAFGEPAVIDAAISRGLARLTPYTLTSPTALREEMRRIAGRGVAFDHEEAALGLACAAAPLLDRSGGCRVAISITGPSGRFDPETSASALRQAAIGITKTLNGRPWPP